MNTTELANQEIELLNQINGLVGTVEEKSDKVVYFGIGYKYQNIFKEYSRLAKNELEALKRELFLMWYSMTEPTCFTGIVLFDSDDENRILKNIDRRLKSGITDYELEWMIDYYSNWDFAFERFTDYKYFQARINKSEKLEMPNEIDKSIMSKRGQMGRYWNSLNRFNK